MIEVLGLHEVNKQMDDEAAHLENVRLKMEMIKQNAHVLEKERNEKYHDSVILSGGYYMFNENLDAREKVSISIEANSDRKVAFKSPPKSRTETPSRTSIASDISIEKSMKKKMWKKVKKFLIKVLQKVVVKMREWSRNYRFILKEMQQEKKTLKASMTPELSDSAQNM